MKRDQARQEQFETLLQSHKGIVQKVVRTYASNPDDQSDLIQEIRYQLWKAFPKYDEARSFSTWMYRIALNVAISFARNSIHKRSTSLEAMEVDLPDPKAADAHQVHFLQRLLDSLDEMNRALLLLVLEERTHQEISEILGITETNVATKISRLKQRIRNEN